MTDITDYYETILWPSGYVRRALKRSEQFPHELKPLQELYQYTFANHRIFSADKRLDIPFSQATKLDSASDSLTQGCESVPLSIVTITRNDSHVERMQERTQAFIDSIYFLAEKYCKNIELIIVEWNPPTETPPLAESFNFTANHPFVSVVILTVPAEIHQIYNLSNDLPLYQMIGKNVGIRRARGQFVLATNIDVLLSDELFNYITDDSLEAGKIYRSNRWDVDRKILDLTSAEAMLKHAKELCFQVNYQDGVRPKGSKILQAEKPEEFATGLALAGLHTWACGDFQLLHRDDWAKVRGYSELDAYSFHLDSLFAITCEHAGIKEVALSDQFPHYHIDHTLGTPIKSNSYVINEKKALYHLCYMTLLRCDYQMQKQGDFFVFNDENWGLAGVELPFEQVTKAAWEDSELNYRLKDHGWKPASIQSAAYFEAQESEYLANIYESFLGRAYEKTAQYLTDQQQNKKFFIWGAGTRGLVHCKRLTNRGILIAGFIHGLNTPVPESLNDLPIIHSTKFQVDVDNFVLIASIFAEEIVAQLESQGAREGVHFIVLM